MKFRDVVVKNFFGNIRQYISFFVCNIFSIALFFVYTTLAFNDGIFEAGNDWMKMVMPTSIVGISVFSIFFIIYAHTAFVKGRNKEFGIYLTVGMNRRELRKLVNTENLIIEAGSLIIGMAAGTVFSRIFQMGILNILDIDNVSYHLDYRSYLVTMASFIAIFLLVFIINDIKMSRMDIKGLLIEARKTQGKEAGRFDAILGALGAVLLLLSFAMLFIISANEKLNSNTVIIFIYIALVLGSVYLVISRGGNLLISVLKKRKSYYQNMLSITQIHYKYNQNKKILFTISVLSAMSIMFIASPFSLVNIADSIADGYYHDVEYASIDSMNTVNADEIQRILNKKTVKKKEEVPFIFLNRMENSSDITTCLPIIKESIYEDQTGCKLSLAENECSVIILDWTPGNHGFIEGKFLNMFAGSQPVEFTVKTAGHDRGVSGGCFNMEAEVIVSDATYNQLVSTKAMAFQGTYHFYEYENWRDTQDIVDDFTEAVTTKTGFPVISKIAQYKTLKTGYSSFLFVASVLGVLFFIAGGIVLYFRQYTEIEDAKKMFRSLYKIGITKKEITRLAGKELRVIFYVPLIFGVIIGVSFIYLVTNMVGGKNVLEEFMRNTLYVTIFYIVMQTAFYLLTKVKYVSTIMERLGSEKTE
jgi:putative ABC transport system permease protein